MGSFDANKLDLPPQVALRLEELERRSAHGKLSESERQELDLLVQAKRTFAHLRAKLVHPHNGSPTSTKVMQTMRNGLLVFEVPASTPAIDPDVVRRAIQEEGF